MGSKIDLTGQRFEKMKSQIDIAIAILISHDMNEEASTLEKIAEHCNCVDCKEYAQYNQSPELTEESTGASDRPE